MNHLSASTQGSANASLHRTTGTHLQGRWLALLRLAWAGLSLLALLYFIASVSEYVTSQQQSSLTGYTVFFFVLGLLVALVWFSVAGLIFWHKSDDWMALLVSLMLVVQGASTSLGSLSLTSSFWQLAAQVVNLLAFDLLCLVFCLFPTGRFVPRWIGWLGVLFLGGQVLLILNILPQSNDLLVILVFYSFLGVLVGSQLYRYRSRATRRERQQTKWIVFGASVTYLIVLGINFGYSLFPSFFSHGSLADLLLSPLSNSVPMLIPLSFGFAMFHSRLWEIDHIINRTLVYGTLTALLAMVYVGLVIGVQALLRGIISQDSSVAIVVSTLAIAALFQPLRKRIQQVIDRRFYRPKYDANKAIARFSASLRGEVDLNQVSEQLVAVVEETMQPTHVSLWLRPLANNETRTTWEATPFTSHRSDE